MAFGRTALLVAVTAAAVLVLPGILKPKLPESVSGYTAKGWEPVGNVFRQLVKDGTEKGGAIAVYHKGELVVEYSGGYADEEAEWPWNKDTLNCFFSSTKGVSAIVVAMLVDRGLIEYDKAVATYWPEFAQNGKEKITVRQILSHTAGLAWIDEPFNVEDILKNPTKVSDALAKQKPNWEPGSQHGYHALTIGMYIDQLVRRVDKKHRDLAQFFSEEVTKPHGIDFFIGLPFEENYRCARLKDASLLETVLHGNLKWAYQIVLLMVNADSGISKAINNPSGFSIPRCNDPRLRAIPCGASRGFGTAIGLAKLYSMVAAGKLMSRKVLDNMIIPRAGPGIDRIIPMNLTYASGLNLYPTKLGSTLYGTPGAGGQMGVMDPKYELSMAYSTNYHQLVQVLDDRRWTDLVDAVYDVLKNIQ